MPPSPSDFAGAGEHVVSTAIGKLIESTHVVGKRQIPLHVLHADEAAALYALHLEMLQLLASASDVAEGWSAEAAARAGAIVRKYLPEIAAQVQT